MALSSRILSKSKQLYTVQTILPKENVISVRYYAKAAPPKGATPASPKGATPASPAPPGGLKGDEMLKGIFLDVKKKFETALSILRQEKITIAPEDPAAVQQYANVMKTVREKADLFSESQRIQYTIQTKTHGIPDARTYLLTLKEIRLKRGLSDDLGAEALMFDALDKVEKEIKKPLMRDDNQGMDRLMAEFDKINKKLGINPKDLPKYEEQLELKIAKAQLEELKKETFEAMDTQVKKEEFKDEEMVEPKSLDIRNFI